MGPAAIAKLGLDAGGRTVRGVTGGSGGTAFLVFATLFGGWLFVSGRLPRVLRAIAGGQSDSVIGGVAVPGSAPLPPAPVPPGLPRDRSTPGGLPQLPNADRPGPVAVTFSLASGRRVTVGIDPGSPSCASETAGILRYSGAGPEEALALATGACLKYRLARPAGLYL